MEDRLEKFIIEKRNEFDDLEPPAGMWDKINNTARQEKKIELKPGKWKGILWKAAGVLIIFGISFTISEMLHRNDVPLAESEETFEEAQYPQLIEAEAYYTSQVNKQLTEIDKFTHTYPEIRNQANYDISELDSLYQELKNDLKDNVDNEEVVEAMIQNYRLKVQILQEMLDMLHQLENPSDQKTNSHEI